MQTESKRVMRFMAIRTEDDRHFVCFEGPDGTKMVLEPDQAVAAAINLLQVASRLYPSASEFSATIDRARSESFRQSPTQIQ